MNEETQIQIIELMDDGATLDSSPELRALVEASTEAKTFYYGILVSESMLDGFFGGDKLRELDNKIDTLIDDKFKEPSNVSSINFKPFIGFAVAASLAVIAFTFINSPAETVQPLAPTQMIYEETQVVMDEKPKPLYISGEDMADGLWGPASVIAEQIGRDRYEVMYAIYEANKENFIDSNINQPKSNENFFVDLSIVENLDSKFVVDEVKRHIFCNC